MIKKKKKNSNHEALSLHSGYKNVKYLAKQYILDFCKMHNNAPVMFSVFV